MLGYIPLVDVKLYPYTKSFCLAFAKKLVPDRYLKTQVYGVDVNLPKQFIDDYVEIIPEYLYFEITSESLEPKIVFADRIKNVDQEELLAELKKIDIFTVNMLCLEEFCLDAFTAEELGEALEVIVGNITSYKSVVHGSSTCDAYKKYVDLHADSLSKFIMFVLQKGAINLPLLKAINKLITVWSHRVELFEELIEYMVNNHYLTHSIVWNIFNKLPDCRSVHLFDVMRRQLTSYSGEKIYDKSRFTREVVGIFPRMNMLQPNYPFIKFILYQSITKIHKMEYSALLIHCKNWTLFEYFLKNTNWDINYDSGRNMLNYPDLKYDVGVIFRIRNAEILLEYIRGFEEDVTMTIY